MSLADPVLIASADPLLRWRRHYTGQLVTLTRGDDRTPLRLTPGHPVLTHLGWRRADAIVAGVHVVATDPAGSDAATAFDDTARYAGAYELPVDNADFHGDGDRFPVTVTSLDLERAWPPPRPWTGDHGPAPFRARPGLLGPVLDALCTPAEFSVATWNEACAKVPGLAQAYPGGPPPPRDGITAEGRARLGPALTALPPTPLDRDALGARLLGQRVPLRLVEITGTALEPTVTVVHDVTDGWGAVLAAGIVVGG